MPVYNSEKYLADSIESILAQTHKNFEFIIVNDASTDNSENIILSFKEKRIRYIKNEVNHGNAFCRNLGLKEAKGKYLVIQDSDDISLPGRIEKQLEFMEGNPKIGIAGSFIKILEDSKEYIKHFPTQPDFINAYLFFKNPIAQPSVIIRRNVLIDNKLKHIKYFEDFNLWYQASKVTQIANIPEVLVHYRFFEDPIKKKHRNIKDLSVKVMFWNKLKDLEINIPEEDFELLSNFIRTWVRIDNNNFKRLDYHLKEIRKANKLIEKYPHKYFKASLVYDHLRLWLFFYRNNRLSSLPYLFTTIIRLISLGVSPLCIYWRNLGKYSLK